MRTRATGFGSMELTHKFDGIETHQDYPITKIDIAEPVKRKVRVATTQMGILSHP